MGRISLEWKTSITPRPIVSVAVMFSTICEANRDRDAQLGSQMVPQELYNGEFGESFPLE
jgi:hypothetical protein